MYCDLLMVRIAFIQEKPIEIKVSVQLHWQTAAGKNRQIQAANKSHTDWRTDLG